MCPSLRTINPLGRFKKASILIHILYHASKESVYGVQLKEKLSNHGYEVSDGTLYPWLNRLEYSELLEVKKEVIEGKMRKYYSITDKGMEQLTIMKKYLLELYQELTEE